MIKKNNDIETKSKSSSNGSKKKKMKRKKAKVVMPKFSNLYCPSDMSLEEWLIALRQQQAKKESFAISQMDEKFSPGVYRVCNSESRSEYKVVYRRIGSMWNFCSCLDFKTSQFGPCKHIEGVKQWIKDKHKKVHREEPAYTSIYMGYKGSRCVRIRIGEEHKQEFEALAVSYFNSDYAIKEDAYIEFDVFMQKAKSIDENFSCYNDALDYIIEQREKIQRTQVIDERYTDAILDNMLSVPLYPY